MNHYSYATPLALMIAVAFVIFGLDRGAILFLCAANFFTWTRGTQRS